MLDRTDCDRLRLTAGVALFSRCRNFLIDSPSCLECRSALLGLSGDGDSRSDNGLISRSSLDGLRGRKLIGVFLFFHGVEVALRNTEVRP